MMGALQSSRDHPHLARSQVHRRRHGQYIHDERPNMYYPAELRPTGDGWLVTFPDIPEAVTAGATREEAIQRAFDALVTTMTSYLEARRAVPLPSRFAEDQVPVQLPPMLTSRILRLYAKHGSRRWCHHEASPRRH